MASVSSASSSTAVASNSSRAQAEARAAVIASLESAGSNYDNRMQRRAADLHANSAAISKQEAQVQKNTAALAKESAKWQKELDKTTKGLKEFGDLQNFAEMMERDFLVLEETLRLVEGGQQMESASGGSQWR
jgi:multidrug resistance efflux pump